MDILDKIFLMQSQLMDMLGMSDARDTGDIYRGDILVAVMGMASEAGEVLSEVNVLTRPWAKKPDDEARQALAEEAVDVLFFFTELMILLGLTPEDVLQLYTEKWEKNRERFRQAKESGTIS